VKLQKCYFGGISNYASHNDILKKEETKMRTENELKSIAAEKSNGNDIIGKIIYGALLEINAGTDSPRTVASTAEYIAIAMLPDSINCYDTVFCPIMDFARVNG
jgi:hypothetical protein